MSGAVQHGIEGQLLTAIKSLYVHSELCVRVNSATTKPFRVSVGLRQGCSLVPILFLIYRDRIAKNIESCAVAYARGEGGFGGQNPPTDD